jgi:hypothetical protein
MALYRFHCMDDQTPTPKTLNQFNYNKADIQKILGQIEPVRKFNALKYCGKLRLTIDPLKYQKQIRDEWE